MSRDNSNPSLKVSSLRTSFGGDLSIRTSDAALNDYSSASLKSVENECISKIIEILELDDSTESEIIAKQLMIKGRKALHDYEEDITPNIFRKQINDGSCELLETLKCYVEQQWKAMIPDQWFHQFLEQQISESRESYNKILTRAAEYGSKFTKDNALLSLVIQFLFEFDDDNIENTDVFNQLWNSLICEGLQGIRHYEDFIAPNVLQQQLQNDQSPLRLALSDYFSEELKNFLQQKEININRPEIFKIALACVTNKGWLDGLNDKTVTNLIVPKKVKILNEKSKEYINNIILPIRNRSPPNTYPDSVNREQDETKRQERIRECTMITMCINEYEKLQLSNLVEAGELVYMDKKLDDVLGEILSDYGSKKSFSSFISTCLTPIMYLLKRHQNLDDFCESLFFKYSQINSVLREPILSLRMIIHILLLNSDLSLSRKIMSLLSKRNPVPFVQPSLKDHIEPYELVSDIIHVWNYSVPTILSFGIGECQGKSTLLNTMFLSSFEQSMPSIYFQNTIDIDFGYSFLPRRSTNIADAHGSMMKNLFEQIHELFDGFIIHVEYKFLLPHIDRVQEFLHVIQNNEKYRLIIIRDVPTNEYDRCSNFLSSNLKDINAFILPDVANQNNKQNKHFILTLRDKIWENIPTQCRHNETYLKNRLEHLMNIKYKQHLREMYEFIMPLQQELLQTVADPSMIKRCFPEYLKFAELCQLNLTLARFNFYGDENDAIIFDTRRKIFELESQLDIVDNDPSIIHKLFLRFLQAPNMLTCLELLGEELKKERSRLVSTADMATQLPLQKNLSLEVLWRNAIVCSQKEPLVIQKYNEFINAGFPFEIVDGDNFYFPYSFLFEALKPFCNHRTLVISVIGPQNSGKSTLLNYMFGTLFDVRDGRCTRGIYGSFVKTNRTDFEYILLIDTEGLLSIEREDPEFDRRIVLFCLAVSHIVLVNMVGEVSTTLQSMLTLCTDSLEKMGVTRIPQPIVHFILNQKADLNIENNRAAIDRIISDLKKFGLGESIDIRKETFHTLPSAYKKEGQTLISNAKLPKAVKTAPEFIECVQSLCGEIIHSAESYLDRVKECLDPLQWLSSSKTIFDTLQKFSDLTYYQDIYERRLDDEIREHIRNDLTKIFSTNFRDGLIVESSHKTEQEIHELFLSEQSKIQETARENLQALFKLLKVPDTLRRRTEQFLSVQIIEMFNALQTSTIAVNERERVKLIVRNGEGDLQKLIQDVIQSGQQMSIKEASTQFNRMFDNILQSIKRRFIPEQRLKQAMKHIFTNHNIYEKQCLPHYAYIANHFMMLSNINDSQLSIDDVADEIVILFTRLGYQESSVIAHSYNPKTQYSIDMIYNLIYLNKQLLKAAYTHFINEFNQSLGNHQLIDRSQHHNKGKIRSRLSLIIPPFREKRAAKQFPSSVMITTEKFQLAIRDHIRYEKPTILEETRINEDRMYFAISRVIAEIISRIRTMMESNGNGQTRQIRTELIQRIVGIINSLIIEVDNELAPFCLSLSLQLKSTFHTCAVILLTQYYYDQQMKHFFQTVSELDTKKDDLKSYFISMVVSNASIDENYAMNFAKKFKEHLIKLFMQEGQHTIHRELKTYDCLNRKWIQDRCDGLLLTSDHQWLLDYIENPTKIIEQFFTALWGHIEEAIDQKLTDQKGFYVARLNEFFFCIQGMLETASKLGAAATFVNDVFLSEETNILDVNKNLINKQRCMASLFMKYFTVNDIPISFNADGKMYRLRNDALDAFRLLLQQRPPSRELSTVIEQTSEIYNVSSIGNLVIFLQTLLRSKETFLTDLNRCKSDFKNMDSQETYANLLDKVRGCQNLCPCCRRPCDVDHTQLRSSPGSQYNEHRCLSGHSLRGMNGYKFEFTEEPSLFMCEQIKDHQIIVIGSVRCRWSQFKKDHPDWIFDSALNDAELNRLHGKFLTVWQKVGRQICEKFNMKFVLHNTPQKTIVEAFHFILMLDASGSMSGGKWRNLIQAVQEFLDRRRSLETQDRITIMVFSDRVDNTFSNEEINNVDVNQIPYLGGLTSFKVAFTRVNECIIKFKQQAVDNFAIVFMSDGDDEYPEQELNQLVEAHDTVIQRFWTVALNDGELPSTEILKRINDRMNGSFYDVTTSHDLIRVYAEVATDY
ncbi:unnamed protein product [Rotaria socialis]|uniref:Uncharacterized protein n=1 Tax=Rotaria socialis TaxID=392032 RepID=A0A817MGE3_9BILA|nr:unnamed protein product [Rotaria socialis]